MRPAAGAAHPPPDKRRPAATMRGCPCSNLTGSFRRSARCARWMVRSIELLEALALTARARDAVKTYSGGMKRCVNLGFAWVAAALGVLVGSAHYP